MNLGFKPANAEYKSRVYSSFEKQQIMKTLGVSIQEVTPGQVTLEMPFHPDFTQQHGFLHAGTVATVLDSACGYSAYTLMPADAGVLSIEFKVNLLRPAQGSHFRAIATVDKPGRNITFCTGKMLALEDGQADKTVATMSATIMTIYDRTNIKD